MGSNEIENIRLQLEEKNIPLKLEWLETCFEFVLTHLKSNAPYKRDEMLRFVVEQFSHSDMEQSYLPLMKIPVNAKKAVLTKRMVFQVISSVDISRPIYEQLTEATRKRTDLSWFTGETTVIEEKEDEEPISRTATKEKRRMWKLKLTDGVNNVSAVDYLGQVFATDSIRPGTKILLTSNVKCRKGILQIDMSNCQILGGDVESLYYDLVDHFSKLLNVDVHAPAKAREEVRRKAAELRLRHRNAGFGNQSSLLSFFKPQPQPHQPMQSAQTQMKAQQKFKSRPSEQESQTHEQLEPEAQPPEPSSHQSENLKSQPQAHHNLNVKPQAPSHQILNPKPQPPSHQNLKSQPPSHQNLKSQPPSHQNLLSQPPSHQNLKSQPPSHQNQNQNLKPQPQAHQNQNLISQPPSYQNQKPQPEAQHNLNLRSQEPSQQNLNLKSQAPSQQPQSQLQPSETLPRSRPHGQTQPQPRNVDVNMNVSKTIREDVNDGSIEFSRVAADVSNRGDVTSLSGCTVQVNESSYIDRRREEAQNTAQTRSRVTQAVPPTVVSPVVREPVSGTVPVSDRSPMPQPNIQALRKRTLPGELLIDRTVPPPKQHTINEKANPNLPASAPAPPKQNIVQKLAATDRQTDETAPAELFDPDKMRREMMEKRLHEASDYWDSRRVKQEDTVDSTDKHSLLPPHLISNMLGLNREKDMNEKRRLFEAFKQQLHGPRVKKAGVRIGKRLQADHNDRRITEFFNTLKGLKDRDKPGKPAENECDMSDEDEDFTRIIQPLVTNEGQMNGPEPESREVCESPIRVVPSHTSHNFDDASMDNTVEVEGRRELERWGLVSEQNDVHSMDGTAVRKHQMGDHNDRNWYNDSRNVIPVSRNDGILSTWKPDVMSYRLTTIDEEGAEDSRIMHMGDTKRQYTADIGAPIDNKRSYENNVVPTHQAPYLVHMPETQRPRDQMFSGFSQMGEMLMSQMSAHALRTPTKQSPASVGYNEFPIKRPPEHFKQPKTPHIQLQDYEMSSTRKLRPLCNTSVPTVVRVASGDMSARNTTQLLTRFNRLGVVKLDDAMFNRKFWMLYKHVVVMPTHCELFGELHTIGSDWVQKILLNDSSTTSELCVIAPRILQTMFGFSVDECKNLHAMKKEDELQRRKSFALMRLKRGFERLDLVMSLEIPPQLDKLPVIVEVKTLPDILGVL